MRILAVDVGAGTQDILLFDSGSTIENCYKMVLPSPTVVVASRIKEATKARQDVILTGYTMGGGACGRALTEHLQTGLCAFATPRAAATFDDDLDVVRGMGVIIISDDEASKKASGKRIVLRDLDLDSIRGALGNFCVDGFFDAVAVAVQDHGAAPAGVSDRVFRFEYLKSVVSSGHDLCAFAYSLGEVPPFLTRMKAVAESFQEEVPLLILDTGPAAALGALEDKGAGELRDKVIVNIGNGHTLAVRVIDNRIVSLFEHHTHSLTPSLLDSYLTKLIAGTLSNEEIFENGGHGALIPESSKALTGEPAVIVTGPRRHLMETSRKRPYFAAPHGDMMLSGCFGLVRAFANKKREWQLEIEKSLVH